MRKLVESIQARNSKARKWKEEIGYVMEISPPQPSPLHGEGATTPLSKNWRGVGGEVTTLVVRPWLHAPEIDSYDEIFVKQIVWTFDKKKKLEIGNKIIYTV
jgi:hypothetical protein